jgi:hypothetical protein
LFLPRPASLNVVVNVLRYYTLLLLASVPHGNSFILIGGQTAQKRNYTNL